MAWLQENGFSLFLLVMAVGLVFRGPILSRFFGIVSISVHDLANRLGGPEPPLLVDVRSTREFNQGHVREAVLVPLPELREKAASLRTRYPDRGVAVICRTGNRSLSGAVILKRAGFPTVCNVAGGMLRWEEQGYPRQGG
ncbi:MAG: rhodanese-like domain-containing protein [Magnetococcales bacterium]|nr:rhodanese-like domain-containing protein [Magnetococcales bacterium]MBF0157150.1 rhodanese-like domain-containing protein [Magnetococcales bacterium]